MKKVMMGHIMDTQFNLTRFELQYKAVTEFKWSSVFLFTGNFRLCQMRDCSWVHVSLRQHGQGNQMANTPQLSMTITTMEWEIVDVNVSSWDTEQFSRTSSGITEFPETWVTIPRLESLLLAWRSYWLVKWKKKVLFQARNLWNHVIFSMSSNNR